MAASSGAFVSRFDFSNFNAMFKYFSATRGFYTLIYKVIKFCVGAYFL